MIKIHFLSDSPKVNTGFSNVTKNLAIELQKLGYDVSITGIQTSYNHEYYHDVDIYPLYTNQNEDAQFLSNLVDINPDIVIYVGDMYTDISYLSKIPIRLNKKLIVYCPVEGSRIPKRMVRDLNEIAQNGKIIAQCQYGYEEMKRCGVDVDSYIYHGIKPDIFKPMNLSKNINNLKYCYFSTDVIRGNTNSRKLYEHSCYDCKLSINDAIKCPFYKEETVSFLSFNTDTHKWTEIPDLPISKFPEQLKKKFVYLFVGANHSIRKRIERLLEAYSQVTGSSQLGDSIAAKRKKDRTHLHLHTNPLAETGLPLLDIIMEFGIEENVSFSYGSTMSSSLSEEAMAIIYNSADVHVSATSSEGFGLSHLESMACGLPNIAPNCTSLTELISKKFKVITEPCKDRGLLAKIITDVTISDNSKRSLVDMKDLALQMDSIYGLKDHRDIYSKNCIEFANQYTWNKVVKQWDNVIKDTVKIDNIMKSTPI